MRVLFVYPNLYTQMGFNHGLASLSAVLREAGHETRLVNLNEKLPPVPEPEDLARTIREVVSDESARSKMATAAHETATQRFTVKRMADGLEQAIRYCDEQARTRR